MEHSRTVKIHTPYIKLQDLLKVANLVSSGGEGKIVIQEGQVSVNGAVCTERGKKLRGGDTAAYQGVVLTVQEAEVCTSTP